MTMIIRHLLSFRIPQGAFRPIREARLRPLFPTQTIPGTRTTTRSVPTHRPPHRNFSSSRIQASLKPFLLFDVGEGITEVEIVKWHVEEGQKVEEFDPLCEVQSDKSVVELTASASGTVHKILKEVGDTVKVGENLCDIKLDDGLGKEASEEQEGTDVGKGETGITGDELTASPAVVQAEKLSEEVEKQAEPLPAEPQIVPSEAETTGPYGSGEPSIGSGTTNGRINPELASSPSNTASDFASSSQSTPPSFTSSSPTILSPPDAPSTAARTIIKTSPAIRTLAAKHSIDLSSITPTGEGGRITKDDIENVISAEGGVGSEYKSGSAKVEPEITLAKSGPQTTALKKEEDVTRVEFGRTRKVMYRAMSGMGNVPHFGYSHTLNLTKLLPYLSPPKPHKAAYQASDIPSHLSRPSLPPHETDKSNRPNMLTFLVKALYLALEEHPVMRSRVAEEKGEKYLEIRREPIVGIAVSDPKNGLLTPSLPPTSPKTTIQQIHESINHLKSNPTRPTLPPNLTISSVGGLGEGRDMMPVIPLGGGVAIAAVGRAEWTMEWVLARGREDGTGKGRGVWGLTPEEVSQGGMRAVLKCHVGWSGDHRVLEGAELIAFTESWKRLVEEPASWVGM